MAPLSSKEGRVAGAPPALAPALFRVAGRGRPQPRLPSAPLFEECLPTLCPLLSSKRGHSSKRSAEGEGEDGEERGGGGAGNGTG